MLPLNIGSMVHFKEEEIQVFVMSDTEVLSEKIYGSSLLVSEYLTRLCSTIRTDKNAKAILLDTMGNIQNLDQNLAYLSEGYRDYNNYDKVTLVDHLDPDNPKKRVSFIINYDLQGHFTPVFKPKGFGLLGKNIEIYSVTACLATINFLMQENKSEKTIIQAITDTVSITNEKIANSGSLGTKAESAIVKATAHEVYEKYF